MAKVEKGTKDSWWQNSPTAQGKVLHVIYVACYFFVGLLTEKRACLILILQVAKVTEAKLLENVRGCKLCARDMKN